MNKSYLTIITDPVYGDEPVYEISDDRVETLIALSARPMRHQDTADGDWTSPQAWLAEVIGDQVTVNDDTKIYVAPSPDHITHLASLHNLTLLST